MIFTEDSQIVKDYLLLLEHKEINIEDVPDIFNLKEIIEKFFE